jgi:hypothetical protein
MGHEYLSTAQAVSATQLKRVDEGTRTLAEITQLRQAVEAAVPSASPVDVAWLKRVSRDLQRLEHGTKPSMSEVKSWVNGRDLYGLGKYL